MPCRLQEAEGGALAGFTGTMRYSSGLIADQKRTAAALVRVSKMMGKVRLDSLHLLLSQPDVTRILLPFLPGEA